MFRKMIKGCYGLAVLVLFLMILSPAYADANVWVVGFQAAIHGNTINFTWNSLADNSNYTVQFYDTTDGKTQIPLGNIPLGQGSASYTFSANQTLPQFVELDVNGTGIAIPAQVGQPPTSKQSSPSPVTVTGFTATQTKPGEIDFSWQYTGGSLASKFQIQINDGVNNQLLMLGDGSYTVPVSQGQATYIGSDAPAVVELSILNPFAGQPGQSNPLSTVQAQVSGVTNSGTEFDWNGFGVQWDGTYDEVGWTVTTAPPSGEQATITRVNPDGTKTTFSTAVGDVGNHYFTDSSAQPGTAYTYYINAPDGSPASLGPATLTTGATGQQGEGSGNGSGQTNSDLWDVFTPARWAITLTWYYTLAGLSGIFIFFVIVRSGYRYINSSTNPGIKADFLADIQRSIVAVGLIILAPLFVQVLIGIDVGFVHLFANIINKISSGGNVASPTGMKSASVFENIIAAPFNTIKDLITWIFGLPSLDQLVFNGTKLTSLGGMFGSSSIFQGSFNTGNALADAILNLSMLGFTVYFAALYTIRRWVIIATLASTPIIVWIWALTEETQVLEIWAAEIVSTIFLQVFQALSLGIFVSVLDGKLTSAQILTGVGIASLVTGLKGVGVWLASIGGVLCLFALVVTGYKLMVSGNSKTRAEVKLGMGRAVIGMGILGLSLEFAGFLIFLLNSPAVQLIQTVKTAIGV